MFLATKRPLTLLCWYRDSRCPRGADPTITPLGSFVTNANQGCNTAYLFRIDGCRRERDPDSGDLEEMELLQCAPGELLTSAGLAEMGVLSYVTLALLAERCP